MVLVGGEVYRGRKVIPGGGWRLGAEIRSQGRGKKGWGQDGWGQDGGQRQPRSFFFETQSGSVPSPVIVKLVPPPLALGSAGKARGWPPPTQTSTLPGRILRLPD